MWHFPLLPVRSVAFQAVRGKLGKWLAIDFARRIHDSFSVGDESFQVTVSEALVFQYLALL